MIINNWLIIRNIHLINMTWYSFSVTSTTVSISLTTRWELPAREKIGSTLNSTMKWFKHSKNMELQIKINKKVMRLSYSISSIVSLQRVRLNLHQLINMTKSLRITTRVKKREYLHGVIEYFGRYRGMKIHKLSRRCCSVRRNAHFLTIVQS